MSGPGTVASAYNLAVHLDDGRVAIFNPVSRALLVVSVDIWDSHLNPETDRYRGKQDKPPAALQEHGLLVPVGFDELAATRIRFERARWTTEELQLTIVPTLACNLRCPYCFEGGAMDKAQTLTMPRAVEGHLLRWIARELRGLPRLSLTWYGGEPLLALDMIERTCGKLLPALDAMGVAYGSAIISNGTRLTADVAERLAACRVSIAQVSVDVPASTRRDASGSETMGTALDGAVNAIDAGIEVALRVNVLTSDEALFDNLYDAVARRNLSDRLKNIDFHFVHEPECPPKDAVEYSALSLPGFEAATVRERRKALALGLPVKTLSFARHALCEAVRDGPAIVDPSGRLYKCMEEVGLEEFAYGSVVPGVVPDDANLLPWLTHDWFSAVSCAECILLPQCAGGCPRRRIRQPGSLPADAYCFPELKAGLRDRIRLNVEEYDHRADARTKGTVVIDAAE